jgi:hypothetical protein
VNTGRYPAHYGTFKDALVAEAGEDVRRSRLYGLNDEKLGKIDDVIFDHSCGEFHYVVVDARGWLDRKKFLVPAERLRASAKHRNDDDADVSKRQIGSFAQYNESDPESETRWRGYEERYRAKRVANPVMHRAETDRNLTPTSKQTTGNLESESAAEQAHGRPVPVKPVASSSERTDWDAAERPTERAVPAGTDSVVIDNTAVDGRWDTFQSRLRERRKEAVARCRTCSGESAGKRVSESADTLRKAG